MKKLMVVVLALLFLLPVSLLAQEYAIDKGSINVGGTAGFEKRSGDLYADEDESLTIISLNPNLLYFIAPNLGIGVEILYDKLSVEDESLSMFGIGPRAAYFIGSEESKVYPFIGASFFYAKVGEDGMMTTDRQIFWSEGTSMGITPFGGVLFMLSKSVGMSIEAFYRMDSFKEKGEDKAEDGNRFGVRIGIAGFIL